MDKNIEKLLKKVQPWAIGFLITTLACVISYILNGKNGMYMLLVCINMLFGIMFFAHVIAMIVLYIPSIIGKITGKISRMKNVLDKTDFEKYKEYYREILHVASPLIVGYIDNLGLDFNNLIAELLYLKKKKIIDIKDGKIEKISESYLKCSELELLEKITNGKLRINNYNDYLLELRKKVTEEAEELSLVNKIENKMEKKTYLKIELTTVFTLSFILTFLISIFLTNIEGSSTGADMIPLIIFFMFLFFPLVFLLSIGLIGIFANKFIENRGELYKRTAKGRELNQKLEGLKNYLKDYSLMEEREAKEIELWDDYLIYSVMFGQNKKIIEEYEKYIEIIE